MKNNLNPGSGWGRGPRWEFLVGLGKLGSGGPRFGGVD